MHTSVNLQEQASYSVIPLLLIILVLGLLTIILIFIYIKSPKKEVKINNKKVKEIPEKNIKNIPVIKNKYLEQLDSIKYKYDHEMVDLRKAYQLISETIRLFVFEITDITTQNYSLSEIKKLDIPDLFDLIEEFYEPEFAKKSKANFEESYSNARRVVNEWK